MNPKNSNLVEITTKQQANNGTRQFFDQHHKISYISYSSGYVRREIKALYTSPWNGLKYKVQDQFVINPRKGTQTKYGYTSFSTIKVFCPQKRLDIIDRISANYKGYKGRFNMGCYKLIAK